jgi:heat shock protein HtpX
MTPVREPWRRHRLINRLQTFLLVVVLIGISALAGGLIFGGTGLWIALGASLFALAVEPAAAPAWTLRLYQARPIQPAEGPDLWAWLGELGVRAGLGAAPSPHYVPSRVVNAFAIGTRRRSAIVLTDGLLRSLAPREIVAVLAHEIAHIANDDLRVMGLADYVSRFTSLLSMAGQLVILLSVPWIVAGEASVNLWGLLLLALSPQLALLAQLGLSRVREFDADDTAARLTGDPRALASALDKIERADRSWRSWLLPGWRNPEPSWLRTHPPSEERIARLLALDAALPPASPADAGRFVRVEHPVARPPRWFAGGVWR